MANQPDKKSLNGNDHEENEYEKSSSEANKQMEKDKADMVLPVAHALVAPSLLPTIVKKWKRSSPDWVSVRQGV